MGKVRRSRASGCHPSTAGMHTFIGHFALHVQSKRRWQARKHHDSGSFWMSWVPNRHPSHHLAMGVNMRPVTGPFTCMRQAKLVLPRSLQLPGTPLQLALQAPTCTHTPYPASIPSCATHAACKFKFHADDEVEWSEVYQLAITSRNRLDFLDKVRSAGFLEASR